MAESIDLKSWRASCTFNYKFFNLIMSVKSGTITIVLLLLLSGFDAVAQPRKEKEEGRRRLFQVSSRTAKGGERFGYIDRAGKLLIGFERLPRETAHVGDFHEGRAVIYLKPQHKPGVGEDPDLVAGYIDEIGKVVIAPRFELARDFHEGLAYVELANWRGFINREGRTVARTEAPAAKDFHEGLAAVGANGPGGRWGYVDRRGHVAIKSQYLFAGDFSEGLAAVVVENGKYGFIDQRGKTVIAPRFLPTKGPAHKNVITAAGHFSEGLACVKTEAGQYGFIDSQGQFVIPPRFRRAQEFSEGLAWVVSNDGQAGWIDKQGRWVVTGLNGAAFPAELQFIYTDETQDWRYSEGLVQCFIVVAGEERRGYMDRRGEIVIEPRGNREFGFINRFSGGLALIYSVTLGDPDGGRSYGYIDRTGRFVWRSNSIESDQN